MGRPRKNPLPVPTEASAPIEAVVDESELPTTDSFIGDDAAYLGGALMDPALIGVPVAPVLAAPVLAPPPAVEPSELPQGWKPRRAQVLGDIFTGLAKFPTQVEKGAWLNLNACPALGYLLKLSLKDDVRFLLPPGAPPYKAHKGRNGSAPSELKRELRRLYVFLEGGNDSLQRIRREKLFQQTLEGLDETEAAVLLAIKERKVTETYGLTRELVERTFPGFLATPFHVRFIP